MKNKKILFELLIIFLIGFTPLLWFRNNEVILGHDSGLTLSPITHFQDRINAWTHRFGFGNDQSYAIPGFFIHGLEALISTLGFSLQDVQKISFIFWFMLPGITMYYFAYRLEKKLSLKYFALPVSILYMLNHFLLQGWFVAERTKFSLYAALPLMLSFLFDWQKNGKTLKTALLLNLLFFFLNGMASLPLFGGILVALLVYVIFYLLDKKSIKSIGKLLYLIIISVFIGLLLNAYWILPYGYYVLNSYSQTVSFFGGSEGIQEWIRYISENSSLINLFRLQGIPEWYQNPNHSYAQYFLNNPLFILISFSLPIGAFYPLLVYKTGERLRFVLFFSFLALISMVFIAGSHPPFGLIYMFFIKYIPGFIAFRTPFYKFAPALWISYSVLLGFTFNYLLTLLAQKNKFRFYLLYLAIIAGLLSYSFPFFSGLFFDYIKGQRSMRVSVPDYISEFTKWTERDEIKNEKMIVLPPPNKDSKVEAYSWGYWSLAPLTSLMSNAPILNESIYMTGTEIGLVRHFYNLLKNNNPAWKKIANYLGIKYIVLRNDFAWSIKDSITDNPEIYKRSLTIGSLQPYKTFGSWIVYKLKEPGSNIIASEKINYFIGSAESIGEIATLPLFDQKMPIYVQGSTPSVEPEINPYINDIYIKPVCVMCDLQWEFVNTASYIPLLTRGSYFYSLWNRGELQKELTASLKSDTKLQYYSIRTLIDILAFRKVADEKKSVNTLRSTLDDYAVSIHKLDAALNEYFNSESFDNSGVLKAAAYIRNQRIILLGLVRNPLRDYSSIDISDINQKVLLYFQTIDRLYTKVEKNLWRSTNETQKRFLTKVMQNKDYTFFYKPNYSIQNPNNLYKLYINQQKYEVKPTFINNDWISLGNYNLPKGSYKIEIEQPLHNLYKGQNPQILNSSVNGSCFVSNKIEGNKNDIFKISFEHRRLSGAKDFFVGIIYENKKLHPFLATDRLLSNAVPVGYTQELSLRDSQGFFIIFCDQPDMDSDFYKSSIRIDNIRVIKLNIPNLVLYAKGDNTQQAYNLEFTGNKINEYLLNNPNQNEKIKFIVFKESSNMNWILEGESARKFTVNGYANGWFMNNWSNTIRIHYKVQQLVNAGFILTTSAFLISLIILIINQLRNEK